MLEAIAKKNRSTTERFTQKKLQIQKKTKVSKYVELNN
jgi:hypothetical protein